MPGGEAVTTFQSETVHRASGLDASRAWAIGSGVALLVAFVAVFWRWFEVQHKLSWSAKEDWGHAYLIPLISCWLLWRRREALSAASAKAFWLGLVPVMFGMAGYAFFVLGVVNHMAQGFCGVIAVYGIVLTLYGPAIARAAFLPIAYLALGVTISTQIMTEITFSLQLIASQGSWVMLSALGALFDFGVEVDGNNLTILQQTATGLVEHPLNVAEACSGMRMVVAFYALACAVALVACRAWWQRIATVLLAGPVAILMNMVRVTVLGVMTLIDPELAAGDAHTLIGTVLLVPSLLLFLAVVWALNRIVRDEPLAEGDAAAKATGAVAVSGRSWRAAPGFVSVGVTLVVLLVGAAWITVSLRGVHLTKSEIYAEDESQVRSIPTETESWTQIGPDLLASKEVVEALGTENYLSRNYVRKTPDDRGRTPQVQLHVAYYTGMIETVPHVPERCFVGGGMQKGGAMVVLGVPMDTSDWRVDESVPAALAGSSGELYEVATSRRHSDARGRRVRLPRGIGPDEPFEMAVSEFLLPDDRRLYAGYFFVANGGTVARAEGVRLLAFDLRSDYAYYMKVQVTTADAASAEEFVEISGDLLDELIAELMRCVPDWVEVELGNYPASADEGGNDRHAWGASRAPVGGSGIAAERKSGWTSGAAAPGARG
ncbi:MAG: hypothetical protein CMJ31_14385 [Phycisphaerae bacterium]|nr:hypothetical protein [Phycisphaerae bacterium]